MARGLERVRDLGPVLGPLHPRGRREHRAAQGISRLDEVSFHMSGTEAVMAAVRLARFNTGRKLIVCFSGAYHGWWDGVQPGLGSERALDDCLTLKDLHPASLDVIRRRAGEIAAVLVNPVQSFHPERAAAQRRRPADERRAEDRGRPRRAYAEWLRQLRAVCDEARRAADLRRGVHRLPARARAAPRSTSACAPTWSCTARRWPGGMPIGVVCGTKALMRRFDPERPMRVAYVVGTFSAHPVVMGAMNEFLRWVTEPATAALYDEMNERCAEWARATNQRLADAALPLRVVHLAPCGRCSSPSPAATTGSSSTTCAPRA